MVEGAPAYRAGLMRGDVLVEVDGQRIRQMTDVQAIVASHNPGEIIKIIVYRNGEQLEFMVELELGRGLN